MTCRPACKPDGVCSWTECERSPFNLTKQPLDREPRRWDLWAGVRTNRSGDREFCDFYEVPMLVELSGRMPYPVTLIEDPDGLLLGWVDVKGGEWKHTDQGWRQVGGTLDESHISMVEHERIFEVQFPNGVSSEVVRGKGAVVRVRAEARDADSDRAAEGAR